MDEIALLLKEMRFRKKLVGGVDESDVWRQLENLQKEYRIAFETQEGTYKALLAEKDETIKKLKRRSRSVTPMKGERHE